MGKIMMQLILMRYGGLLIGGADRVDDSVTMTALFSTGIVVEMCMLVFSRRIESRIDIGDHMLLGSGIVLARLESHIRGKRR